MAELSQRAKNFLARHPRHITTTDRESIVESFRVNNAPIFESLIEFQQKYSGYEFMWGLEPVFYTLLHGDGGYPMRTNTAQVKFMKVKNDQSVYEFSCATSETQVTFSLDEHGRYYEDEIVASSFDKHIENLALWDEVQKDLNFKLLMELESLNVALYIEKLHLKLIAEASDDYNQSYRNDSTFLFKRNGLTSIFTSEDFNMIRKKVEG